MDLKRLVLEIHRRSLWQVLAVYLGAAWVVLQVIDTMVDGLGLPTWLPGFAVVLLLVGLPVVLATAFVQEGAPIREPFVAPLPAGAADGTAVDRVLTWRNALLGGVGALALWGVVAASWLALVGVPAASRADGAASIAVLPFATFSTAEGDRYFADGVHDDILTHLAAIQDLKVISRTSVLEYRDASTNLREIGRDLGVATIMEGSVRREGDRVRVTVQLIDAATDEHLWAENYDRTVSDVFALQTEIASAIAAELSTRFAPGRTQGLEKGATQDGDARDLFYRARALLQTGGADSAAHAQSQALLRQAVSRDPSFAAAWAALSGSASYSHLMAWSRTREEAALALDAAERALELAPDLPEAHVAMAHYDYRILRDYDRALASFQRARTLAPGDGSIMEETAYVLRRRGRFEEALELQEAALERNPRSADLRYQVSGTYRRLHRWDRALELIDDALALDPGHAVATVAAGYIAWERHGTVDALWRIAEGAPENGVPVGMASAIGALTGLVGGEAERGLRVFASYPGEIVEIQTAFLPSSLIRAYLHREAGRHAEAARQVAQARALLESQVRRTPDDPRVRAALGLALALGGQREAAVREARHATELLPVEKDALDGPAYLFDLALVLVETDRPTEALEVLDRLLALPGHHTARALAADARMRAVTSRPDFQALIRKHAPRAVAAP